MIRTFLAFPVSIKSDLSEASELLKNKFSHEKLRWVKRENMHLTIRFFGDLNDSTVQLIGDKLVERFDGFQAGDIQISGLGTFENWSHTNVLWAGIENPETLVKIREMADTALQQILPVDQGRKYRPHLTLARMKKLQDRNFFLSEVDKYAKDDFGVYPINKLVLYQSILGLGAPIYKSLKEFKLR